jgi:serine/threonine protein kinase/tetratricopeptide (TPR) repeat protein
MPFEPLLVKQIFLATLEKTVAGEREAYLKESCAGNPELRRRVEALLAAHQEEDGFMERPAFAALPGIPQIPKRTDDLGFGIWDLGFGAAASERPDTWLGPYRLVQKLGEGGMGTVWVAEQTAPVKRRVALKVVKPGMDTAEVLRRFEQERQVLALMDHQHIARVLDAGSTPEGRPFFVMELVKGVSITTYCDELQLPIRERLALCIPVCDAIHHAHQKGIIHRDLKPANVLVAVEDGQPNPKVIDFGVAKALHQQLTEETLQTRFGAVVGTLEYMSPEQAELSALDIDTRADVYALGVLLYELLTGSTPLAKETVREMSLVELLRRIKEDDPPQPSTRLSETREQLPLLARQRRTDPSHLTQEVRGELDWIVMRCLEKDRTRRYDTASSLGRDLERYLRSEPLEAGPLSRWYRLGKFVARHRLAVIAGVLFVVFLLAAVGITSWLAVQAWSAEALASRRLVDVTEQRDRAESAEKDAAEETAVARAVLDLVQQDLLGQADIANQAGDVRGRDPDVKVRVLLDRAASAAEGRFAGQPRTEAAIHYTLGNAYRALGAFPEAERHLERSYRLRRTTLGADHWDTLECRQDLASLYEEQGHYRQAETAYQEILASPSFKKQSSGGKDLACRHNLGLLYLDEGRFDQAALLLEESVAGSTVRLGADHPQTLNGRANLALLYTEQGKYAEAERILEEVLRAQVKRLGADHPDAMLTSANLVGVYLAKGDYSKAEPLLKGVLPVQVTRLGATHPNTLHSKTLWGRLYEETGRLDRAAVLFEEAVAGYSTVLGKDHPLTLRTRTRLAQVKHTKGDDAALEPDLKEILKAQISLLGTSHPDVWSTKSLLATFYLARKQYNRSEPLLTEVLTARTGTLGADHPDTLSLKSTLGLQFLEQARYDQAEPLLKEVVEGFSTRLGPRHANTINSKVNLAVLYERQRKLDRAVPLYTVVLEDQSATLGLKDPSTLEMKCTLAYSYLKQQRYDKAEGLFREAAEQTSDVLGNADSLTQSCQLGLCVCYEKLGKAAQAEPIRRNLVEVVREQSGKADPRYTSMVDNLGCNLLMQNKAAAAEPLLRECLTLRETKEPNAWVTALNRSSLGDALVIQKKYAEAEPLLLGGYELLQRTANQLPPAFRHQVQVEAIHKILNLYKHWGKGDAATRWQRELDKAQRQAS